MFFKCRNVGFKFFSLLNKINNQITSTTRYNGTTKPVVLSKLIHNRYFCSSNKDDTPEEINYDLITNGNKDLEQKIKILELELEVMRQEGLPVPPASFISTDHWKELLDSSSRSARLKLYTFLFKTMKKKENYKKRKMENALKYAQAKEEYKEKAKEELPLEEFAQKYGLKYNNILLRIYDTTINQMYNNKLIQAIMFGEKLVIDCGYDKDMTKRENMNCAKQLMLLFAENRIHDDPFDLHLCNVDKDGFFAKCLEKFIPTMYDPSFPLHIHENSYLDVFPKDKLVYLTPHCREEMSQYDPDAVYIVGALVDKTNNEPLSLAKAKKEGLRMVRFPLDRYLHWGFGGKSLTLNQCTSILLDLRKTGKWEYALKHVPRRKLAPDNNETMFVNLSKATDNLRYDRPEKIPKWIPNNTEFVNNAKRSSKSKTSQRLINLRQIINE